MPIGVAWQAREGKHAYMSELANKGIPICLYE